MEPAMTPDRPRWLERWLQTEDDDLLYVDQTLLVDGGLTLEEQRHVEALLGCVEADQPQLEH